MLKYIISFLIVTLNCLLFFGQNNSITFLALGDSYTVGTSELKVNSWPVQLTHILRKKKVHISSPKILANPGWTTTDLLKKIESEDLEPTYDMVSLLIGVNNQYKGKSIETFQKEFVTLLEHSIVLAKNNPKNVFVLTIPDWSVTPFARFKDKEKIIQELSNFNKIIKEETQKLNIRLIDITKLSRNAGVNSDLIASDSLHPSKKMYKAWAKKISKALY